ncbi:hypothetical protein AB6N36_36505 [Streptomyces nitrosporeus]|nr:hypothetical protein [Streptomyces nitrosporeus]GGZ22479.1 hypothetical protein GCM10010327_61680 [Streptomyces nitrosporeus]
MTGTSVRATGRRGVVAAVPSAVLPAALGWVLVLAAVFLCCSQAAPASRGEAQAAAAVRVFTPAPTAAAVVVADAPGDRGPGSSCHGATDHSSSAVLPGPTAPVALPCVTSAGAPAGPLTGAAAIRGPSDESADSVDRHRLQIQRI